MRYAPEKFSEALNRFVRTLKVPAGIGIVYKFLIKVWFQHLVNRVMQ